MADRSRTLSLLRNAAAASLGAAVGLRATLSHRYAFRGRTVLITGGSRGLGLVLARHLAAEGARLALCARDEDSLARAREELERLGAEVFTQACDVRERAQVQALVDAVQARFGSVDVLVNNAGVIQAGPLESMTEEDFAEAMDTHFWGPLHATLAVLPQMKARREGRVVNISSIGGKLAVPHLVPYSASKFALVGLSDGLRAELRRYGIVVTTVCPGLMRTGSPRNADFRGDSEAEYTWFSLSDSLPLFSMSAERAARKILRATRRGDAEVVLSVQAKVGALSRALAPNLTAGVLALAARALPQDASPESAKGRDSETPLSRSWLTLLTQRAARRNNEVGPQESAASVH
ncbi:SDR family NAD(P)-dependent oxidoreductase [Aggregicoccus sp. 17bor-14]|uniref:SDR family NAD(P)-dependent oxidoreductase n=1 Tax=Myxococcaceae TaxID=31 RepID=UPI00129CF763|nr:MULTISPECIES: SDR family NAD(P)-dependent oxidoreductase [Myxococcaceae]MBF5043673.1 SDR family NAD(P)-dependent oxidoreductase [Simulacricoccus sp. 17bor-14]MRI89431.1 SDR family NAD(P)-dependent oxidoreductase [Aggregicoccus sp. 17bor-14]